MGHESIQATKRSRQTDPKLSSTPGNSPAQAVMRTWGPPAPPGSAFMSLRGIPFRRKGTRNHGTTAQEWILEVREDKSMRNHEIPAFIVSFPCPVSAVVCPPLGGVEGSFGSRIQSSPTPESGYYFESINSTALRGEPMNQTRIRSPRPHLKFLQLHVCLRPAKHREQNAEIDVRQL